MTYEQTLPILVEQINKLRPFLMDLSQLQTTSNEQTQETISSSSDLEEYVSLEAEIPETLYMGMKSFISSNPQLDQYELISSALANFLFQNGCTDRAVSERYLNDLFNLSSD